MNISRKAVRIFLVIFSVVSASATIFGINQLDSERDYVTERARSYAWSVMEAERSLLNLQNGVALFETGGNRINADEVRLRMDLFWSRISILRDRDNSLLAPLVLTENEISRINGDLPIIESAVLGYISNPDDVAVRDMIISMTQPIRERLRELSIQIIAYDQKSLSGDNFLSIRLQILICLLTVTISTVFLIVLLWEELNKGEGLIDKARAAEALAKEASHAKVRFLASASHDLRQPLHALSLMMSSLRLRTVTTDEMIFSHCEEAIEGLSRQVNLYLDIAHIDQGDIVPEPALVSLSDVLDNIFRTLRYAAEEKNLTLRLHAPNPSWMIETDPVLLERILTNLVGNAISHTGSGGVLMGLRRIGGAVRIDVIDTGPGIPGHLHETIFQEFEQLGNPARSAKLGHGLGLSIARRMARMLGTEIMLSSTPGRGTRFSLSFPLIEDRRPAETRRTNLPVSGQNQATAPSSAPAPCIDKMSASASKCDRASLGRDEALGAEMSQTLDQPGTTRGRMDRLPPSCPFPSPLPDDAPAAGTPAAGTVSIPDEDADDILSHEPGRETQHDVPPGTEVSPGAENTNEHREAVVLIVDDDPMILSAMLMILEDQNIRAIGAETGEEALDLAGDGDVLAVMTDFRLPGISGLELVSSLRILLGRPVPACITTGDLDGSLQDAARNSMIDLLHKPVTTDALIKKIQGLLTESGPGTQTTFDI